MIKPLYVAELTINHLGMVKIAKAMIRAAKNSGADFVKLKIKNVKKYYDDSMPDWRNFPFSTYRQSLELSKEDFLELDRFCKELGIPWFATIHDAESLEFIKSFNPPMYKVASMDIGKTDLIETVADLCQRESKPLVLSVGGKNIDQIDKIVELVNKKDIQAYILHTVSIYPTPLGRSNINFLSVLKKRYEKPDGKVKIGYSGHENGFAASLLAALHGASMIERHFTLSSEYQIHHIEAALIPAEFKQMVTLTTNMLVEYNTDAFDVDQGESHFLEKRDYSRFPGEKNT